MTRVSKRISKKPDTRHPCTKRGTYAKISDEKRIEIINHVVQCGITPEEASKENRIAVSTINSWVNSFRKNGQETPRKRGGVRRSILKITPEISDFIKDCLDNDIVVTLQEIQSKVMDEFGVRLSLSGIANHVSNRIGYTLKNAKRISHQTEYR